MVLTKTSLPMEDSFNIAVNLWITQKNDNTIGASYGEADSAFLDACIGSPKIDEVTFLEGDEIYFPTFAEAPKAYRKAVIRTGAKPTAMVLCQVTRGTQKTLIPFWHSTARKDADFIEGGLKRVRFMLKTGERSFSYLENAGAVFSALAGKRYKITDYIRGLARKPKFKQDATGKTVRDGFEEANASVFTFTEV